VRNDYVNLAVVVAEFPETANTWRRGLNGVLELWKAAKHRKFPRSYCPPRFKGEKPRRGRPKSSCWFQDDFCSLVANTVLTDSYAIAPLVKDVENAVLHLSDTLSKPIIRRLVVTASDDVVSDHYSTWKQELWRSDRVVAYLQHHSLIGGIDQNEIGFGSFAENIWELTPYSFVVDWFIGVGDWLKSLDAMHGTTVLAATTTTKWRSVMTRKLSPSESANGWQITNPGYGLWESHSRSTTIPPIDPRPEWVASATWYKVVNGISLAYQRARDIMDSNKRHCAAKSKSKPR
jgi:hypothetical protein